MQHHAHAAPMSICTHPMLPNGAAGAAGPPPPPPHITQIQAKVAVAATAHVNGNTTTTHQHNTLPPYQPHQTSIQMQKIRQQHQHINYKNNNNNNSNNNNNNNNNHINKNSNYNNYNNNNNNNNSNNNNNVNIHNHQQNQSTPKQILTRNVAAQQHQLQAATASTQQQQHQHHQMGFIKNQQMAAYQQYHHNNNNNNSTMMNYQPKPHYNQMANNKMKYNSNNNNSNNSYNNKYNANVLHKNYAGYAAHNNKTMLQQNQRKTSRQNTQTNQQQKRTNNNEESAENNNNNITSEENTNSKQKEEAEEDATTTTNEPDEQTNECDKRENNTSSSGVSSSSKTSENNNNNNNTILSNEDETVSKHGKEKTPMCLVNELARFNKITHQYRLTSEKGPAHCKRFTVTLKLGEEEYSAEGFKIKKAQHMAAAQAIEQTKYKHPIPKTMRRNEEGSSNRSNITPTVALNALAMKLGQQTYYLFDPRQMPAPLPPTLHGNVSEVPHDAAHFAAAHHAVMPHPQAYMRRPGAGFAPAAFMHTFQPRFANGRGYLPKYSTRFPPAPSAAAHGNVATQLPLPPHAHHYLTPSFEAGVMGMAPCKITLIVGKQKFVGTGRTLQQAKHHAAAQALHVLKAQQATQEEEALNSTHDETDEKKSPISLVHEIGIKRDLAVRFKVLREEGPAHMRRFITACIVGTIVTEGEGNGKKVSKKRAAEKMLEELKKLPAISPVKSPQRRIKVKTAGKISLGAAALSATKNEKRKRVSNKDKSADNSLTEEENPVTKLMQLQQLRKAKEPMFELVAKNGSEHSRRKEFIVEVTFQSLVARGVAVNKKLAKRNAAQNMLDLVNEVSKTADKEEPMHVLVPEKCDSTEDEKEIVKVADDNEIAATTITKDAYNLPMVDTTAGQVPGILILRPNKKNHLKKKTSTAGTATTTTTINNSVENSATTTNTIADNITLTATVTTNSTDTEAIAKTTTSTADTANETNVSENNNNKTTKTASTNTIMKEQLLYLSKLMGFEVCFNDYPKGGSHSDFLTIVTLSTDPPQICHGTGCSSEESQNDAARNALKILSELGLNSAKK